MSLVADSSTFLSNWLLLHEERSVQRCTLASISHKAWATGSARGGVGFCCVDCVTPLQGSFLFLEEVSGGGWCSQTSFFTLVDGGGGGVRKGSEVSKDLNVLEKKSMWLPL